MIRIAAAKTTRKEQQTKQRDTAASGPAGQPNSNSSGARTQKAVPAVRSDIAVNLRLTCANDEDAVEHEIPGKGRVTYSPQYSDDQEVFRHVRVSSRLFREVQALVAQRPNGLLTREDVALKLGIPMSADWKHYMTHTRARMLLFKRPRRYATGSTACLRSNSGKAVDTGASG